MASLRWARGLTTVLLLIYTVPAAAEVDCAAPKTSSEANACSEQELKTADAALQAAYKAALRRAEVDERLNTVQRRDWKRALQEGQRKWIAFRDADCGAPIGWEQYQASGLGAAVLACRLAKTDVRIKDLTSRYGGK